MSVVRVSESGQIKEIKKCTARVEGLSSYMNGQMLDITADTKAMVMGFDDRSVSVFFVGRAEDVRVGDTVYNKAEEFRIPVGDGFLNRVVNALAEPLDGKGPVAGITEYYPVFREAPGVLEREPLADVFETGNLIIDATIPIGKGQRELIVGDKMIGKTSLCLDAMIHQKNKNMVCIYCCIGRSQSALEKVVETLRENDALSHTIIVSATAYASPGEQYLAPYTACTLGEYFMRNGRDVFVVFDDLTRHAWAYRQISLLLERAPGREAYPGDIFYVHSQLMERAGKFSVEFEGGSMTFFPIVDALAGDITGYIPSNLVSMTDGQIYMNAALFNSGFKPAIDLGLSVSRIGNKIQSPAMKELSAMLRLEYVQYMELLKVTRFKTGTSTDVDQRLKYGEVLTQLFIQDKSHPRTREEEMIFLYALRRKVLELLSPDEIERFKENILRFSRENYPLMLEHLLAQQRLTPDITTGIDECLVAFFRK
ncbi:MAG: F0F1 ATP synthase subunit alpha [Candidatus Omnitrophica bacterium]|nr:F0F1 ATP synthase subunit alpha [Candidatus Omnitrophota bacterium]